MKGRGRINLFSPPSETRWKEENKSEKSKKKKIADALWVKI